jgi:hypothetical protein
MLTTMTTNCTYKTVNIKFSRCDSCQAAVSKSGLSTLLMTAVGQGKSSLLMADVEAKKGDQITSTVLLLSAIPLHSLKKEGRQSHNS